MTDTVLLKMYSRGLGTEDRFGTGVIRRVMGGKEALILIQASDRDCCADDDEVVLDRDTQHALYLLLKNRFE
jgi:predicted GTPase